MNPLVEFVAADAQGVISKETWRATNLCCPRCANKHANIWALVSENPIIVLGKETRIFLCISCNFTGVGLNGMKVEWDTSRRAQQIIEFGFTEEERSAED
jgi:hypothetical protein